MQAKQEKILFIINPISGSGKGDQVQSLVQTYLNYERFEPYFLFSEYGGHAKEIAAKAASEDYEAIIAVGGDGTFNEVAAALVNTPVAIGVLPIGSGNGMAGHLKVPMELKKAIQHLNRSRRKVMDTATCNGHPFIGCFGVGFDAKIAVTFARGNLRGFWGYFTAISKEFFAYRSKDYILNIDGKELKLKAFILCVANSSEYGNKAIISPNSDINDGKINLVVIQRMPLAVVPFFARKLFLGKVSSSSYFKEYSGKEIFLIQEESWAHIDGEPIEVGQKVSIAVKPASLNLLC